MAGAVSSYNFFVECETCCKGFESDAKCNSHLAKVCDLGDCNHKELQSPFALRAHQTAVHGVGGTQYLCAIKGCDFSSPYMGSRNNHEKHTHNFIR